MPESPASQIPAADIGNVVVGERRAMLEANARLRAAMDAIDGVLWTNDAAGRMTGEQPAWGRLTGQSFDAYQGYGWADAVHPDDSGPTVSAWNLAVTTRQPFVFEHRVRRHDGVWRRFAIRAIPVFDDADAIREWVGVHTDITEATETRLLLARSAETFASLVRNNPFGIYVVDAGFKLSEYSLGAAKVFSGIDPLIGRDLAEILRLLWTEPFASEVIARFRATLATGEPYVSINTIEVRANIDATEAYDWRIERIALPDGTDGVACWFYDLSERMALENDLRQAVADKELLAREIEHRVQNSLMIVGSLLALQRATAGSIETKDALAAAASRVLAIGEVHRRLHKSEDIASIEFADYLRQLCADIEKTFWRSDIAFDVQSDTLRLSVDKAVPLGIAANELITNACKYCGAGLDQRVIIRLIVKAGSLVLSVTNTGSVMAADFTPDRSSGLGLRVIKTLARQIGGEVVWPKAAGEPRFEVIVPR